MLWQQVLVMQPCLCTDAIGQKVHLKTLQQIPQCHKPMFSVLTHVGKQTGRALQLAIEYVQKKQQQLVGLAPSPQSFSEVAAGFCVHMPSGHGAMVCSCASLEAGSDTVKGLAGAPPGHQ